MSSALGDFLISCSHIGTAELPVRALQAGTWPRCGAAPAEVSVQRPAPNLLVACSGDVRLQQAGARGALGLWRPPAQGGRESAPAQAADGALRNWLEQPGWTPAGQTGRFFYVGWDAQAAQLIAFTDLFRTYPVYHCATPSGWLCASDLRLILAALPQRPPIDPVAVYHYLNFAYIPSPRTALAGVNKLAPGSRLQIDATAVKTQRIQEARYGEDLLAGSDAERAHALREKIVQRVSAYRPGSATEWGTFLSGGTDSSSISGILARASTGQQVDSFSIGFGEGAYDELAYSRIAVEHFGLLPHERVVDEAASVTLVDRLISGFDEPFGNSSAIPTYYCAELALTAGKTLMIGGDGGDEIFGGNERYAKDQIFSMYHHSPAIVRGAGRLLSSTLSGLDSHWSNRIRNMIHRGNLPNPDRFYQDDSFASDHFDVLLSSDFRSHVGRDDSLQVQREIYARAGTSSELHRLMYLDLQLTIAESDLVKVIRSAKMAGIDVAFPYLDQELVEYTGRLGPRDKVRGVDKRYLFKRAMQGILPTQIINKKKQGFGLPIAVWLRDQGPMRQMVDDVMRSRRTRERGLFEPVFVERLMDRHERGSWDHAPEIFRLLMLELWQREYLDV